MSLSSFARVEQSAGDGRVEVGARRIYILPTRYGVIYAVLLFLMLLGAVNYGNNPSHLLTFLLGALGSNAIYLTWRNLRGTRMRCLGSAPVFAGQPAVFVVEFQGDERERPGLQIGLDDCEPVLLDLEATQTERRELRIDGLPRGLHPTGRLVLSTQYPVGLFRAWCYVECAQPMLVYPRPGERWNVPGTEAGTRDGEGDGGGTEDFAGLRRYLPGDQPSRIDWKSYARDRGLNTRLFSSHALAPVWLDWEDAPGAGVEAKLSALCRAVLDAERAGREYGLRLPQGLVSPGSGPAHRHQCLRQLALHGSEHA
ncbi:MAG: DUF58 domain-containing protein [Chromatiaceae bacterium]|nr:DUF58 domain-containing protein [Gammaproteobacteria bacterium]MCP5300618.1 DUF58 domain-containing protein [Chromatiaceae bacterium]MCP5422690.1 DUF58 domain-containing protein [Chromatiaceae bacterium]